MDAGLTADGLAEPTHAFLIRTAVLLHRYGTPSHRLERVMVKISQSLGLESVFLYTPTALVISIGSNEKERTYLRRVNAGSIDADKLLRFDAILERLEAREITVTEASRQMEQVANRKPPYSPSQTALACGISCGVVAIIFGGSLVESLLAGTIGLSIALWELIQTRLKWEEGLLFPLAGFGAAMSSLIFARYVSPIDDRLVALAALVVLLPGFMLTVALTELAVGHLSAGVARLAGASAILLTLVMGVAIAWRMGGHFRNLPIENTPLPFGSKGSPWWWPLSCLRSSFVFAPVSGWLFSLFVSLGFLPQSSPAEGSGSRLGPFAVRSSSAVEAISTRDGKIDQP